VAAFWGQLHQDLASIVPRTPPRDQPHSGQSEHDASHGGAMLHGILGQHAHGGAFASSRNGAQDKELRQGQAKSSQVLREATLFQPADT